MATMEGKKIPTVTFHTRQNDQWVDITTAELFDNKTIVVFSLPGAFTQPAHQLTYLVIMNLLVNSKN